ncbi:MAG: hypothetical protein ACP5HG_03455 [Anaerolineae bacterium]
METSLKAQLARSMIQGEDPEEIVALVDAVLPAVVDVLSKSQLKAFVKHLFEEHLATLLRGMDRAERAALLQELLPIIAREFPMRDVDLNPVDGDTL